jgi:hypothetical protein
MRVHGAIYRTVQLVAEPRNRTAAELRNQAGPLLLPGVPPSQQTGGLGDADLLAQMTLGLETYAGWDPARTDYYPYILSEGLLP